MEFSRPEYWSEEPIPSPADLLDPGIKQGSPALQVDSLPTQLSGKPINSSSLLFVEIVYNVFSMGTLAHWPFIVWCQEQKKEFKKGRQ